ncbi:ATP-binding protein [Spirillospora sp. NPDC047279]|uniref:ATP-binding protein n=1 Tax=Spirillospora sp. NPDC047279 TaxID=3155478 RepID=UPI0033C151F1
MNVLGTISLPGVARSAPQARTFVRRLAGLSELPFDDETVADMQLCVDELVANACEHTASGRGGRVTVTVSRGRDRLRVSVIDDGGAVTKPCVHHDLDGENGRGLRLVDALSARWGVEDTTVWVEF